MVTSVRKLVPSVYMADVINYLENVQKVVILVSMAEDVNCTVHTVLLACVIKELATAWKPALQDIMENSVKHVS